MSDGETHECPHCGEAVDPTLCRNVVGTRSSGGRERVQYACYKCGEHLPSGFGSDGGQYA